MSRTQRSVRYAQVRIFRQRENQHNFWNCLTLLNKHLILSRSLKKPFSGNYVKISDCRAFSLFKTLPGCRAYSHSEILKYQNWAIQLHVGKMGSDHTKHRGSLQCILSQSQKEQRRAYHQVSMFYAGSVSVFMEYSQPQMYTCTPYN